MFVCVFAKKFPALALQSCCEVSRPRAVGEYKYRLLVNKLSDISKQNLSLSITGLKSHFNS